MTAVNFPLALKFSLSFEGGKVNIASDPGGRTAYGVTQATFSAWLRANGKPGRSVYTITPAEYSTIYKRNYWDKIGADALPSGVDLIAFDIAVNMGPGRITPWLEKTAHLDPVARIRQLDRLRCGFWRSLRTFRVFGKGWMRRETACLAAALDLAK